MSSSRDRRDIYYRKAKEEGWRARSAFKLIQLDETFHFLSGVTRALDLCAAPGSWSQVLSRLVEVSPDRRIVAVDLQEMAPIDGVIIMQGDITREDTARDVVARMEGLADVVICDGAPDVTGMHDLDEYMQSQLVAAAVGITTRTLRAGGWFVAKMFKGRDTDLLVAQLRSIFEAVCIAKPASSRPGSAESFVVCENFVGGNALQSCSGFAERVLPFVLEGDLAAYDREWVAASSIYGRRESEFGVPEFLEQWAAARTDG